MWESRPSVTGRNSKKWKRSYWFLKQIRMVSSIRWCREGSFFDWMEKKRNFIIFYQITLNFSSKQTNFWLFKKKFEQIFFSLQKKIFLFKKLLVNNIGLYHQKTYFPSKTIFSVDPIQRFLTITLFGKFYFFGTSP